jgi:hypothetical protein
MPSREGVKVFEQKNHGQDEQKSTSLDISSPEVTEKQLSAYDRLVLEVKHSHPENITEKEAHQIARRLMGFCERLIRVNDRNHRKTKQNQLDEEGINGNVTVKKRGK